jgi:hypothetical protein
MKVKSTFSVMLVAILSLIFSANVQSNSYTGNSDLFLVLKNNGTIPFNGNLKVRIQMDVPTASTLEVTPANTPVFHNVVESYKVGSCKDGKVDVDIIIRGGSIRPMFQANQGGSEVRIKIFDCDIITVDNISGVHQASGNGNNYSAARVTKITAIEGSEESNLEGMSAAVAVNVEAIRTESLQGESVVSNKPTAEVVLYPNPVTDGVLFIKGNDVLVDGTLTVHNALGATVVSIMVTSDQSILEIPVDKLSKGVYYARIQTSSGLVIKKFNVTR